MVSRQPIRHQSRVIPLTQAPVTFHVYLRCTIFGVFEPSIATPPELTVDLTRKWKSKLGNTIITAISDGSLSFNPEKISSKRRRILCIEVVCILDLSS